MSSHEPSSLSSFTQFQRLYWNLSRELTHIWKNIYASRFPGSQSHILFLLEKNGRKKMSELAGSLYLTPGAVTSASDKLLEKGYIARVRDDQDRRIVYLEMTEEGKNELSALQNEGKNAMKTVFSHLSESDLTFFIDKLSQATEHVTEFRKECE